MLTSTFLNKYAYRVHVGGAKPRCAFPELFIGIVLYPEKECTENCAIRGHNCHAV
jgi:hypothetical protein